MSISINEYERFDLVGLLFFVGVSRLKIKVFDNVIYYGGLSLELDEIDDGEFETSDTKYWSIVNLDEFNR